MTVNRYVCDTVLLCFYSWAALQSRCSIVTNFKQLFWPLKKKSGPRDSSNRASEMLNKHNIIQQGHNERHFLHISFINIMKSPSVGKGRERMEHRKMSAVSFIPWADLKIQVKKKKVRVSLLRTASDVRVHTMTTAYFDSEWSTRC